ncbi:oligopeptide transporter, OPT family [Sphingomonas sp. RB56-2]|uniref:Oligopeptide transporter, OPT family n=1 Tax=Sphingomonas brevis TaxID=2908206 RepID=A0ABT0SD67_9SPHN|nr:oligopeptide transporter, OPT family [Sphingomonas brevis]MCL6742094.1 oligopeptide transporter, OPT family [Sphingomonas brevis]
MASSAATTSGIKELTLRGIILGALITVVFTAANVYLGLKIGITFATSIPAAVISMAILKAFRDATIQENNIVQTIASAAGTLSAIIFVLPGLIMVGWWTGFPYWLSVAVIGIGGILGVMYSVPLRRALVTGTDLPYPEGVAAAEVLKVGSGVGGAEENRRGLVLIGGSTVVAALYFIVAKTRLLTDTVGKVFKVGTGGSAISASLSMALIGVGHLVGVAVGAAMVVGMLITWAVIVPHWTQDAGFAAQIGGDLEALVSAAFRQKARMVGAGTIGVAAIWTLLKIIGPIVAGIRSALIANQERKAGRGAELPLTERDIPIGIVTGTILLSMIPIGLLLYAFGNTAPISAEPTTTIIVSVFYVLIAGVVIAAVCGYMAGLIGASNSPISGVGILSVLGISLILVALFPGVSGDETKALVAFALFVTAIIFGVATISNNNLQDLKTGQLVDATPWRQQVALVLGVVFGALVIPPILDLLNTAFTFEGAPGAKATALAAPQAAIISTIAQGVLGGSLDWSLIRQGAIIGVVAVIVDELLKRSSGKRLHLPPLAIGMGIYLPLEADLLIPLGAVLGWFYNRWAMQSKSPAFAERMGVLMATGLIVGESLMGVVFAAAVAGAEKAGSPDSANVFALVEPYSSVMLVSMVVFAAAIGALYYWTKSRATDAPAPGDSAFPPTEATVR